MLLTSNFWTNVTRNVYLNGKCFVFLSNSWTFLNIFFYVPQKKVIQFWMVIDRYRFFITDTNYLHVYVSDNQYAEAIFIYWYKINNWVKSILRFGFSSFVILTTTKNGWKLTFFHVKFNLQITTIKKNYLWKASSATLILTISKIMCNIFKWRK